MLRELIFARVGRSDPEVASAFVPNIFTDRFAAQNVYLFTRMQKLGERCSLQLDTDVTDDTLGGSRAIFLRSGSNGG